MLSASTQPSDESPEHPLHLNKKLPKQVVRFLSFLKLLKALSGGCYDRLTSNMRSHSVLIVMALITSANIQYFR